MSKKHSIYVGLDSGRYSNFAVMLNGNGNKINSFAFQNDHKGCKMFADELTILQNRHSARAVIGFEGSGGHLSLLTNYLNHGRFTLKGIQPIQIKRHKDYFTQPIKSDEYDAYIIADYLRTQDVKIRELSKQIDPNIKALKELSKLYKDFTKQKTRYTNKLHQVLTEFFPEYVQEKFFSKVICRSSLILLSVYPTPCKIRTLSTRQLAKFLYSNSHGRLGNSLAEKILKVVKSIDCCSQDCQIYAYKVCCLANAILTLEVELKRLKKAIGSYLKKLPEAKIVSSLPGADTILTARFLGAIESVDKFYSSDALALYCGVACIDDKSGKKVKAKRAYRINKMAKDALMQIAGSSIKYNPLSLIFYQRKIKEGKRHWQAIKSLARNIVRVLYVMLKNKTEYMPQGINI